jgi:UDP-N-acetylglucosamine 2-epimerase (non-hydrolysing)
LVTEPAGRENLIAEGIPEERIHFVGNTMIDTMAAFDEQIKASSITNGPGLADGGHVLVTMHRPGTVDDPGRLAVLVEMLKWLAQDRKVVLPIHPRTQDRLERQGLWNKLQDRENLLIMGPLDYFAFQKLLATAAFVVTDSGGVQEETTWRGVPCLTLRPGTERPVTIDRGTNRLVPLELQAFQDAVAQVMRQGRGNATIPDLWDGHATERVLKVLTSVF